MIRLYVLFIAILLTVAAAMAQHPFPGSVVTRSPNNSRHFCASPSIVHLGNGHMIVSNDWGGNTFDAFTSIHQSLDSGATWAMIAMVPNMGWATLFTKGDTLYLFGTDGGIGNIVLKYSVNRGFSWSSGNSASNGLLRSGDYHTGPTPVLIHMNRIWKAFERDPGGRDFHAFVISAPVNSNWMLASSWTTTNEIRFDTSWINGQRPNWFEGNVVPTATGVSNMLRLENWQKKDGGFALTGAAAGKTRYEVIGKCDVNAAGTTMTFMPATGLVSFKGAESKFTIRYDTISQTYYSISNRITAMRTVRDDYNDAWNQRNVLILQSSKDLITWKERRVVVRFAEGRVMNKNDAFGFQYPDWQFMGTDIIMAVRTAWYGWNRHDANTITYHRIKNFRDSTLTGSSPDLRDSLKGAFLHSFSFAGRNGQDSVLAGQFFSPASSAAQISRGPGLLPTNLSNSFAAIPKNVTDTFSQTNALQNGRYFEIGFTTPPGQRTSLRHLRAKLRRNNAGLNAHHWYYSVGNAAFEELGEYPYPLLPNASDGQWIDTTWLGSAEPLQNMGPGVQVRLRCYVWGNWASGGNIAVGRSVAGQATVLWIDAVTEPIPAHEVSLAAWSFAATVNQQQVQDGLRHTSISVARLRRLQGLQPGSLAHAFASTMPFVSGIAGSKLRLKDSLRAYEIEIQKPAGNAVQYRFLKLKLQRREDGPSAYQVFYSINSSSRFYSIDSGTILGDTAAMGRFQPVLDLRHIAALQAQRPGNDTIRFRIYFWGQSPGAPTVAIGRDTAQGSPVLELVGTVSTALPGYSLRASGKQVQGANEIAWQMHPPTAEGSFTLLRQEASNARYKELAVLPYQHNKDKYSFTDHEAVSNAHYIVTYSNGAQKLQSNVVKLAATPYKPVLKAMKGTAAGQLQLWFCTARNYQGILKVYDERGALVYSNAASAASGSTVFTLGLQASVHAGFAQFTAQNQLIASCAFTR